METARVNLPESIQKLIGKIRKDLNPKAVVLFGSRARGDHRPDSDFDIAVRASNLDQSAWHRLLVDIEEEAITLRNVDLVHYESMSEAYKLEIDRDGVILE